MKNIYFVAICALSAQFTAISICNAQTTTLKTAPADIAIDGNSKEWGDSVNYTTDKLTNISYSLTNDNDMLYLVIRTKDASLQGNILGAGLTFSVDVKGRKKSTYAITYPISTGENTMAYMGMAPEVVKLRTRATHFKKIKAEGFDDISDDELEPMNRYGIKAAVGYDDSGYLVYEEAIPLRLFHAGAQLTKEWAFNVKLNELAKAEKVPRLNSDEGAGDRSGPKRPGFGPNRAQKSSPGLDKALGEALPAVDFWGKFTLAKVQ